MLSKIFTYKKRAKAISALKLRLISEDIYKTGVNINFNQVKANATFT